MLPVAIAGFVALAAWAAWALLRGPRAPSVVEIGPGHPDVSVIAGLVVARSDFSKLHEVDVFLNFPTEAGAARARDALAAEGYQARIERSGVGELPWSCSATKHLVPTLDAMIAIRARMEALAAAGGGVYDGWGAAVVPL